MENSNLLYESKGCPKGQIIRCVVGIVILAVLATICIVIVSIDSTKPKYNINVNTYELKYIEKMLS